MWSAKKQSAQVITSYGGDILGILLSFGLAYWVRFSQILIPAHRGVPPLEEYLKALFVVLPTYLWIFRSYGLYEVGRYLRRVEEIFVLLKGVVVGTIVLMAFTFLYRDFSYSRLFLVFLWVAASVIASLIRYGLIQWTYQMRKKSKGVRRVLIVGHNRNARNLIEWMNQNPHLGYRVEGVLVEDGELVGKHLESAPIVGTIAECNAVIGQTHPEEVIVADPGLPKDKLAQLLLQCEDGLVSFKVAADLYGIVTNNLNVEYVASVPLLGFRPFPLDDPWNRLLKRTVDIAISTVLMVLAFPIFLLTAVGIKLTDRGPIFFAQERVGQDGRHFKIYKFRTMRDGAEKETGPVWAKQGDERCTGVGRFLRRFNLDELPQFWNVLKGDMSFVGPRPERPHFVDQFRSEIPRYMARHKVKSGITGWAQVNGLRGNTSLQERIKYDLYYMENWSLLFDLEILFMTLFAFRNAY